MIGAAVCRGFAVAIVVAIFSVAAGADDAMQRLELPGRVRHAVVTHDPAGGGRLLAWTVPVEETDAEEATTTKKTTGEEAAKKKPPPGCDGTPPAPRGRPIAWTTGAETLTLPESYAREQPAYLGAVDLDADGRQEGVLWYPGGWAPWPGNPEREPTRFPEPWSGSPTRVGRPEDGRWMIQRPGAFAAVEVRDGALDPGEPYPLPATLLQGGNFWILRSAPLHRLDGPEGTVLVAGPEARGRQRLRMRWYAEDRTVRETWSLLPEAESVMQYRTFVGDDGEPRWLVLTTAAEGAGPFSEQRLRIFRGEPDRTRLGTPPEAAWTTRANLWQWVLPVVDDFDGDGRVDLLLAYWKGLMSARVVLDLYRGTADGFRDKPDSVGFDVKGGERGWIVFEDLDGDGDRDLLVRGKKGLILRRGDPKKGRLGLAGKPDRTWPIRDESDGAESEVTVSGDGTVSGAFVGARPWLVPRADGGRSIVLAPPDGPPRLLIFEP